jgi:hypothetical protein
VYRYNDDTSAAASPWIPWKPSLVLIGEGELRLLQRDTEGRSMNLTDNIIVSSQAVARQLEDEIVILHLGNGTYFGLDVVGARIWQLMGEGKSLNEVCNIVLDEYEVSREDIERDIVALTKDLLAHDLVSTS